MKRVMGIVVGMLLVIGGGCKSEEEKMDEVLRKSGQAGLRFEYFEKLGFGGTYYKDRENPEAPRYEVEVSFKKKQVDFYTEWPGDVALETMGRGIKWNKYKKDKTNRTISLYRKNGGDLIITVQFISSNEFRIIEMGDWLSPDYPDSEAFKGVMDKNEVRDEQQARSRFNLGMFYDLDRVYVMD